MERDIAIGRIIGILSNQIKRQFDSSASKTGVTGVQGRVLHYLLGQPREQEIFQKDLEEEFNLRRSSATGILQLMENAKKSSTVEGWRRKRIILSCKGKERIAARLKIELTSENNRAILLRCKIKCRMGYKFFLFLI